MQFVWDLYNKISPTTLAYNPREVPGFPDMLIDPRPDTTGKPWGCDGYLWMDAHGLFKVGRSKHIQARPRQSQTYNSKRLTCAAYYEREGWMEKFVHQILKYRGKKVQGEWFETSVTEVNDIMMALRSYPNLTCKTKIDPSKF